jgi:leucyl/phenylalanyl-tRNA---protein transferase
VSDRTIKSRVIEPRFLLTAYCNGYFPMADPKSGQIGWYSPDPRAIFPLEEFRIPRSLKLTIKKKLFEIRTDTHFEDVMWGCANRDETWISAEIVRSYVRLFELGFAHSVESWRSGRLAGGLYGVAIGGAFFGESMFSAERDASKVALVALVHRLKVHGYQLLDTQYTTPHLLKFGAKEIPRERYLELLQSATARACTWS